jgi:hypothetical protein
LDSLEVDQEKKASLIPWRRVYDNTHVGLTTKGNRIALYDTNGIVDAKVDPRKDHDYYVDCFLQWRLYKARESQFAQVGVSKLAQLWGVFSQNPGEAIASMSELRANFNKTAWGRRSLLHDYCLLEYIPCANQGFCPRCSKQNKRFHHKFRSHPSYNLLSRSLRSLIAMEANETASIEDDTASAGIDHIASALASMRAELDTHALQIKALQLGVKK